MDSWIIASRDDLAVHDLDPPQRQAIDNENVVDDLLPDRHQQARRAGLDRAGKRGGAE